MDYKSFNKARMLITFLIAAIVAIAVVIDNFYLAITGVFIGVIFLILVKRRLKEVIVDERVISISGKASRMTYSIATVFFAVLGLFLTLSGRSDGNNYIESVGVLFSYTAMFMMLVYSVSYHYFNKKYGGDK